MPLLTCMCDRAADNLHGSMFGYLSAVRHQLQKEMDLHICFIKIISTLPSMLEFFK